MDPANTPLNDARDELFRLQATASAQRFQQQLLARPTFRSVDGLIVSALALIGGVIALCCLIRLPKHHVIHGVLGPASEPMRIQLAAAAPGNSHTVLNVTEGQPVASGDVLGAVVGDRQPTLVSRAPVAGTVTRIDWADGGLGARITLEPASATVVARYDVPPELSRLVRLHQKLSMAAGGDARRLSGEVIRTWTAPGPGGHEDVLKIAVRLLPDAAPAPRLHSGASLTATLDEERMPLMRLLMPDTAR